MVAREFPAVRLVPGPRRGLGPNRNRALTAATGDRLLFLDDDAELAPDFVAAVRACLEAQAGPRP